MYEIAIRHQTDLHIDLKDNHSVPIVYQIQPKELILFGATSKQW